MTDSVIRIKRYHYIHILDNNTNVTRTISGPVVYTRKEHETCLFDPCPCVSVPPRHYCVVKNPCVRDEAGEVVLESSGQVKLRLGDSEIRFEGEPFPLYPGEELDCRDGKGVQKLQLIPPNTGLHVRCVRDFKDADRRVGAGTEWMVAGPQTYIPRVEVVVVEEVKATVIYPNTALLVQANVNFTDRCGVPRVAGEKWLVRALGAYLKSVEETVLGLIQGTMLSDLKALRLSAVRSFTDVYGKARRAGEQWQVTLKDAPVHIVDAYETKVADVAAVSLSAKEYVIIHHPVDDTGHNRFGETLVRRGECTFFLQPGETMPRGVEQVLVVGKEEALLLEAVCEYRDGGEKRQPGSRWMVHGPLEYIPANEVKLLEHRRMMALDKNEGIYIMNTTTGEVRAVIGKPYMLDVNEVLWEKHLPLAVEELLESPNGSIQTSERNPGFVSHREKYRIVRFNVQHNAAVQIYDYRKKQPRIVLGPNLVMLAPHEEFTVLSLSGGTPKVPNSLQSLQLFLGPRFSSDTIVVETSDHARLRLRLSYNWYFDIDRANPSRRTFSVPDFIGDCCKTIASRVRGAVAAEDFDSFHRNSAKIIRTAVFGVDEAGETKKNLRFTANDFVVTNIDVQSSEPTDEKTRDSLQKSVQLAIEITTKSQEAAARHGNELKDQEAKGQLERQKLLDKIEVENARTKWLELQAKSEAVQASGQSVAEAKARAEALLIEVRSEMQQAEMRAKAYRISAEAELQKLQQRQALELEYTQRQNEIDVSKARAAAEAEAEKVKRMVDCIGRDTLVAIARAGPETQVKLLSSLGLKGYLITDGNSPVNLFGTAQGMIGEPKK
ncbi:major vault protein, putative [Leishmania donovani]|uniref:Major vault protein n=1 Tax=Leishmania donovani TaxID=5661 RepID=E9B896_LEIDO|nr:major vault protein, putative [Leishmania donovani]AYU75911.1 major vault protein, putative [Leishmania donovani]CBZ31469.1 major vault protein, putative [Leishmania donovani]